MKLIDKSAVVAVIEEWVNGWSERLNTNPSNPSFFKGGIELGKSILYLLSTLEVKDVDVEEKATQLSQKYFPDEENIWARTNIEAHKCKSACIEIVEWFKTQIVE